MLSSVKNAMHLGSSSASKEQDLCEACGLRPKFVENGVQHPFCGRSCAVKASTGPTRTGQNGKPKAHAQQPACALPNCQNAGRPMFTGFCSDAHAKQAVSKNIVQGCAQCGVLPRSSSALCATCQRGGSRTSTTLKELDNKGTAFKSVVSNVVDSWDLYDNDGPPRIQKVFEILQPRKVQSKANGYRKSLQRTGTLKEISTFHSSQCVCDLGTQAQTNLCDYPSCGICSIVKSGFTTFAFGAPSNIGSHGPGIYSYTSSTKADKHATSCTSSPYRVMILCNALVSNNQSGILSPTNRSVIDGETVIVTEPEAITPMYVIMYSNA